MFNIKLFKAEAYLWWKTTTLTKDEEGFYLDRHGDMQHLQGKGKTIESREYSKGGIFTHFHPLPQSRKLFGISYGDVTAMLIKQDRQMRVVYPHGVYRIINAHWDRDYIPYLGDWEVMCQSKGLIVYSPISRDDLKEIGGLGKLDNFYSGWICNRHNTYRKEFKPILKEILGLSLNIVPLGVI